MCLKWILNCIVTKINIFTCISLNFTKLTRELPSLLQIVQKGDNFSYSVNFFVACCTCYPRLCAESSRLFLPYRQKFIYCYGQGNELGMAIAYEKACCSCVSPHKIAIIYILFNFLQVFSHINITTCNLLCSA